jgi:hypothetical protein
MDPESIDVVRAEDNSEAETEAAMAVALASASTTSPRAGSPLAGPGPLRLRLTVAVALPSEQKLGLLLERLLHNSFKPLLVKCLAEKGYRIPPSFVVVHPFSVQDQVRQ